MRLPGIREELEPVTSFDQLREGPVIWVAPCSCGGKHRGMIAGRGNGPMWNRDPSSGLTFVEHAMFFTVRPSPPCFPRELKTSCIDQAVVRQGIVYRVVDPLMDRGDLQDQRMRGQEEKERTSARIAQALGPFSRHRT